MHPILLCLTQAILLVKGRVLPLNGLMSLQYLPMDPVNLLSGNVP
jgi:hypothetical protein